MAIVQNTSGGRMDVGAGIVFNTKADLLTSPRGDVIGMERDDTFSAQFSLFSSASNTSSAPGVATMLGEFISVPDSSCYYQEGGIIENGSLVWKLPVRYGVATNLRIKAEDCKYSFQSWFDNPLSDTRDVKGVAIRVTEETKQGFIAWGLLSDSQTAVIIADGINRGRLGNDGKGIQPRSPFLDTVNNYIDTAGDAVDDAKTGIVWGSAAVIGIALLIAAIWFLPKTGG